MIRVPKLHDKTFSMKKRFVDIQCRAIRLCKAFAVLIFKNDISECRNAIKMVFCVAFLLWWNVLVIRFFKQWHDLIMKNLCVCVMDILQTYEDIN